jgi:LuxR family maltose regulon positive regulatory protein
MSTALTLNDLTAYRISDPFHLIRHRINVFFTNAIRNPVVTVYARTGFGKTRAVCDFLQWTNDPNIIVFDDIHLSLNPVIHEHLENIANGSSPDLRLILIYHELPAVLKESVDALRKRGLVSEINESDLNFTEVELSNYLRQHGINADSRTIREILKNTNGWAFAVSLAVRSLKKVPKYTGFVQVRLKPNIFEFMEAQNWVTISDNLKHFLIRLSLFERLDAELVDLLADSTGCKEELLSEFKQQTAYIRFDSSEGAYFIHHLYLDFLREKQNILRSEEKNEIFKIAAAYKTQSAAV